MSRPPNYPQNNMYQAGPSSQPYQPYPVYQNPFPQQGYNIPGGYRPYPTYPSHPQPNIQYQYPYQYNQPQLNQGYHQTQPYQPPTFGQSLFQPKPSATPEGYSYSPTYLNQPSQPPGSGPSKRPRQDPPNPNINTVKAWRNCSQAGCKFVGSGEDVEVHEGDRHLIFPVGYKVERSEEEERYMKLKGSTPAPTIEGTGIRLETEEDIAKWVAERKSKWPSAKRVDEKAEERNAAIARGEVPRGRGRGRGRGGHQRDDAASRAEDWGREAVEADEAGEGGYRGRGRGRGRGQTRGRGGDRGRGRGRGGRAHGDDRDKDTGWPGHGPPAAPLASIAAPTVNTPLAGMVNKVPGPLDTLGEYDSVTSDPSDSSSSLSDSSSDSNLESASEADEEELDAAGEAKLAEDLIVHALQADMHEEEDDAGGHGVHAGTEVVVVQEEIVPTQDVTDQKRVCKFFAKNGSCRAGEKCKFAHTRDTYPGSHGQRPPASHDIGAQGTSRRKTPRQPPAKAPNAFARPSMLSSLLEVPIQNTLSQLSQTIRFLVANDMLKNVEITPGQADEESRKKRKIEVLDEDIDTTTAK